MPALRVRIRGERGLSGGQDGSSSGGSQRCGLKVVEDSVDVFERLPEVIRPGTVTDTQKAIHPEMVAGHHKHALFFEQPFHELTGVDGQVVANVFYRSGARFHHPKRGSMPSNPFLEQREVVPAYAARAFEAARSPLRGESDTGQGVAQG